jgi:hypothetical protein
MKLFYQPHPNMKPIVKDMLECKEYMYRGSKYTLVNMPLTLFLNLPYTRTLERIDNEHLDGELKKRDIRRIELIVKYDLQFDLNDALSEFGARCWLSNIRIEINQLNGHKVERDSVLIDALEHTYTETFLRARQQDDFTNIGDLDEFRWCWIVKVVNDAEAEQLEQERLQFVGLY